MTRCKHAPHQNHTAPPRTPRWVALLSAVTVIASITLWPAMPAAAQHTALNTGINSTNAARVFPDNSLFATLLIVDASTARINGKPYRIAPGMRFFTEHNALVPAVNAAGKALKVRYVMETSTGMLQTAWVLRESEMPPRRLFGLFGPATQDPQEIQTGPLGVGLTKEAPAAPTGSAASAMTPAALGHTTLQGH